MSNKQVVSIILVVAFMGTVIFLFNFLKSDESDAGITQVEEIAPVQSLIGRSVEGRAIDAFTFGSGDTHVVFVGGVHGGYEWNSVVLAYEIIDYLEEHPESIPENLRISVVPSANPDGVYKVIGKEGRFSSEDALKVADTVPGRFNANNVDLNRNFDCKWQPESMWRGQKVSAGLSSFSEPESVALRDFILKNNPVAVVFWHSQSNAVYASECTKGILPGTLAIMRAYSLASGYRAIDSFDQYEITGDAEGWLASIGIPAITVELETHETVEFNRNLAGVKALIEYYTP